MDREVNLSIAKQDVSFKCSPADFDRFTNEVEPKNKTSAMYNFLKRTVVPADKEKLDKLLELPGATSLIFSEVMSEATSELQISVKKSS